MANGLSVIKLRQRLPHLLGVSPCLLPAVPFAALPPVSRRLAASRRAVLGLGFSFFPQFFNMAAPNLGAKSFIASARQKGAVEKVLENVEWPEQFPFKEEDFQRFDESPDTLFYESPRFVTHIDDPAIAALTKYYSEVLPPSNTPGVAILDMCSSWVSHYPKGYKQPRIAGMGLNEEELKRNPVFTEYVVQDLNADPKLPFEDNTFDVITNVVSVDYLTKPIDIFKEMARVLKPGGLAVMSFSNRCFWTKAISIWTSTGDADHAMIVGAYFHYAGGFEPPKAVDISPNPGRTDPMYVVYSRKVASVSELLGMQVWSWRREDMHGLTPSINMYDRDIVEHIRARLLHFGNDAYELFREGPFGPYLQLQWEKGTTRALNELLTHEVDVEGTSNEFWFQVGETNIRFGIEEFALMTGLHFVDSDFDPTARHEMPQHGDFLSMIVQLSESVTDYVKIANLLFMYRMLGCFDGVD